MFEDLNLMVLLILCPLAVLIGVFFGKILGRRFTETYPGGHPRCTKCGKRSQENNTQLCIQYQNKPWLCDSCGHQNKQALVAATVRTRK